MTGLETILHAITSDAETAAAEELEDVYKRQSLVLTYDSPKSLPSSITAAEAATAEDSSANISICSKPPFPS